MKRISLLIISLMIISFSCERPEETAPLLLEEFNQQSSFLKYDGNDERVKKMIEEYSKLNRSEEITAILIERYGMPNWELPKGNAFNQQSRQNQKAANSEGESSDQTNRDVLIPLTKDSEGKTLAILGWSQLPSGESVFRIFDRQVYEGLSFGQQMEFQPLIINGHFLLFDNAEYGTSEIHVNSFTIKFPDNNSDGCEPGDPDCYCQELRIYADDNDLVGLYIIDCYDMSVVVVAYRDDNGSNDYGHQTTSNGFPSFSDVYFTNNTFYGPGGGGGSTDYSYNPESLFDNPDQPIDNLYNYLRRGPDSGSRVDVVRYLFSLSNELVKFEDTRELAYSLNEVTRETDLNDTELYQLALRGRDIFNRLEHKGFNIDLLSASEEMNVAKDAAFIDFYPEVKKELRGSAISTSNWEGIWEVFKPMLAEILIEAIPGGGLTLAFRDIIEGANNADAAIITAGVVALILEFIPPGKVFKAVWRTGKVVRKGFRFMRIANKRLKSIGIALQAGLKADIEDDIVRLSRNSDEVGVIKNGDLVPTKYGSAGSPVGQSEGGYQLFRNGSEYTYKRTPDVSNYGSNDLNKLTSHPEAHTLQRHGHDVSDEALIKRAQTGIAPDGSKTLSGNPPQFSSKFESADKLKTVLNNTSSESAGFNPPINSTSYTFVYPSSGTSNTPFGYGIPAGGGNPVQMFRVQVVYRKVNGEWKLYTMFPKP